MMSEPMFIGILVLFWLAEFALGAVVIYWFVRQGFADDGTVSGTDFALGNLRLTKQSLGI